MIKELEEASRLSLLPGLEALYEGMEMRVNLSFQLLSAHLEQGEPVSDGGGSEQKIPSHWHHRPLIKLS